MIGLRFKPSALRGIIATWVTIAGCTPSEPATGTSCDAKLCEDGNPCTQDGCRAEQQCSHEPLTGPACADASACLYAGGCQAGTCTGLPSNCDDLLACTVDSCGSQGCVHSPGPASLCDDGNGCTTDMCATATGCMHGAAIGACSDANACTFSDQCEAGVCKAGAPTAACNDGDPCTLDTCAPATGACTAVPTGGACDDGNPCTFADSCATGACVGALDCGCAVAAGLPVPATEDCATAGDDNCNGKVNEAEVCGATQYKFSEKPQCGAACYFDEGHNVAVNGPTKAGDPAGYDMWATGQLVDGVRGVDDWAADLGKGTAYEWVGWSSLKPVVTMVTIKPRLIAVVRLGLNNHLLGSVSQPPQVQVRLSLDGVQWTLPLTFKLSDGSLPAIAPGKRGDVALQVPQQVARFVEIAFATPGSWTFVDEIAFD